MAFERPDMGLDSRGVEASREKYGSNQLTQKKRKGFFRQFLESFGDPIIKILLIALAINVIFLFRDADWFEAAGIAIAVFLATFVSTLSEHGSESAFIKLQEDAEKTMCRVKRAGNVLSLPVADVVVDDIVLLQAGERVPADGLLLSGELQVDQSVLNGESKEAAKKPGILDDSDWDLMHQNQIFRGSVVSSGEAVVKIKRVGDKTFYGSMAREMQQESRESPLKVKLNGLAKLLSRMGYIAAVLIMLCDLFDAVVLDKGFQIPLMMAELTNFHAMFGHILHAVTLGITVVVVAVPEGLPMMITLVLSSNMFRMLKDHVMVRKLVGIETSGSLNILFTDKTGTLTRGKLSVSRLIMGDGSSAVSIKNMKKGISELVRLSGYYNTASMVSNGKTAIGGNATDRALLEFAMPGKKEMPEYKILEKIAFDSARKFSAVHIKGDRDLIFVKGAPEKLLHQCTHYFDEKAQVCPLTNKLHLKREWEEMTKNSVRVIVLAVSKKPVSEKGDFSDLILIGLVGIRDEIRPEARSAVRQVLGAGVQVVMITGDNKNTAAAIAKEVGLIGPFETEGILTSAEMAKLNDAELKEKIPALRVVARALPTDKSRLVRLSQEMGLVAGMTGDGINDAPALKLADVGFAMGSGTEVAKEAGDIVILDDNFSSIGKAILYGRTIFKSIRKFIVFQLTMNLCAVGVSLIGPFIGIDTPVTVIQMLWINIIMDTLAGLAFAGEPPLPEYMHEKPKRREEPVINKYMMNQIVCTGLFTVVLCVLFLRLDFFKEVFGYDQNPIYFLTAFFALFIFSGVFNSFNARTHRLNLFSHLLKNPSFVIIMAAVMAVQILLIYYGGTLFRTAALTFEELRAVLWIAFLVIPADLARKLMIRMNHRKGTL